MKLIGLLVLLGLVSLVEGEVVESFATSCPEFFIKDQNNKPVTPTVLKDQNNRQRYKQICQKYNNAYRYTTLYDTSNRIPVYSAYKFTGSEPINRRGIKWKIEPQLDLERKSKDWKNKAEMTTEGSTTRDGIWGKHQALYKDYSKQESKGKYERGHLYPHCHNCDQGQANSTFTLTNAAPQDKEDNNDWYGQVEKVAANMINNWCKPGTAHVVTGVVPGDKWMTKTQNSTRNGKTETKKKRNMKSSTANKRPKKLMRIANPNPNLNPTPENRVNVPGYFWSAVCCRCRVNNAKYLSEGFLAATKTGMERSRGPHPGGGWKMVARQMPVEHLNGALSNLYNLKDFKVFGDMCKETRLKQIAEKQYIDLVKT